MGSVLFTSVAFFIVGLLIGFLGMGTYFIKINSYNRKSIYGFEKIPSLPKDIDEGILVFDQETQHATHDFYKK